MFPLLALPYMAAGIGALGTGARVAVRPQGQRFMQGGINTLNRFGTKLKYFINPVMQAQQSTMIPGQKLGNALRSGSAATPFFDAGYDASTSIAELLEKLIEKEKEDKDKKDKKKKKKKDDRPEVALKKGGMVKPKKPKKKRKKYKSSTFVKMKGSKRYI